MKNRRVRIYVLSKWSNGSDGHFSWDEKVPFSIDNDEKVNDYFVGKTFHGKSSTGAVEELTIKKIEDCTFYPPKVYLSPSNDVAKAIVRFGNYDGVEEQLSRAKFEFCLDKGEGFSSTFSKYSVHGDSYKIYTNIEMGEVWQFPKSEWEFHEDQQQNTDYTDAERFFYAEVIFGLPKD